jgi:hypothetical protein
LADLPLPPHGRIIAVVLAAFVGHTLAVWTYALVYWVLTVRGKSVASLGCPLRASRIASTFRS